MPRLTAAIRTALIAQRYVGKRLVPLSVGEKVHGGDASIRFRHVLEADVTLSAARIELGEVIHPCTSGPIQRIRCERSTLMSPAPSITRRMLWYSSRSIFPISAAYRCPDGTSFSS